MTQEDIIRMAREAEASFETAESMFKFAALVAAEEREACAKAVEAIEARCIAEDVDDQPLAHVAAAIRARSET